MTNLTPELQHTSVEIIKQTLKDNLNARATDAHFSKLMPLDPEIKPVELDIVDTDLIKIKGTDQDPKQIKIHKTNIPGVYTIQKRNETTVTQTIRFVGDDLIVDYESRPYDQSF